MSLLDAWPDTGVTTYMSGDGRTHQSVARNPMQATQERSVKPLTSVPEHRFHDGIAWLNMSMAGVSHEFFEGLAEADRSSSEQLALSEILDIASQCVTRPFTEDELKAILKEAARAALVLRTGRQPDPDRIVKVPQTYFPNESVAIAPTEAATGAKFQASTETRKMIDADLDTHRKLACPARAAYVLLRDSQEKQMDLLRAHFALLEGGHAGTMDNADVLQIINFCSQCARDADSMMIQIFLLPAANLSQRIMKPAAESPKKSKFGTAVPPTGALAASSSQLMVPLSARPAGLAGRWGAKTAPKPAKSERAGAGKSPGLSPSVRKNKNRRARDAAARAAEAERTAASAAAPSDAGAATPVAAGRASSSGSAQQATGFSTPRGPKDSGRGGGRGTPRDDRQGSARGRGRGRGGRSGGRGEGKRSD